MIVQQTDRENCSLEQSIYNHMNQNSLSIVRNKGCIGSPVHNAIFYFCLNIAMWQSDFVYVYI